MRAAICRSRRLSPSSRGTGDRAAGRPVPGGGGEHPDGPGPGAGDHTHLHSRHAGFRQDQAMAHRETGDGVRRLTRGDRYDSLSGMMAAQVRVEWSRSGTALPEREDTRRVHARDAIVALAARLNPGRESSAASASPTWFSSGPTQVPVTFLLDPYRRRSPIATRSRRTFPPPARNAASADPAVPTKRALEPPS